MERTVSVEEKIRRAEEIYARRHENEVKNLSTLYLNGKDKKDIKLFKKLIIQVLMCLLIYTIVYTIRCNDYIFSEDFMKSTKELLTNDTNFSEIYQNISNVITEFFNKKEEQQNNNDESKTTDGEQTVENEEKTLDDGGNNNEENIGGNVEESTENIGEMSNTENQQEITEEEQEILKIKETTSFIKPVNGVISSRYGLRNSTIATVPKNHTGTDIAANSGTKILSSTEGKVVVASSEGDYGNHLKIQIGEVSIVYAHCSKLYVNEGEIVSQGQEIAEVGSTGNSTGPHLHFEIRLNEKTVDPEKILELQ